MLGENAIRSLLEPFDLGLSSSQVSMIATYLDLLLQWNRKINLTAVQTAEECVTRHFGESLYLTRFTELGGSLLDVGSGAGFPGLALRIVLPEVSTTLLEPIAKKRAFLKEVARACGISAVDVRSERLEEFIRPSPKPSFDVVTARAVGHLNTLVPQGLEALKPEGQLCLWLGANQELALKELKTTLQWRAPISIPVGHEREIWIGKAHEPKASGKRQVASGQ